MVLDAGIKLNDRYRIEATIAQGGMGAIYQAMDEVLGVRVAVKENLFSSTEASRQFHNEASILGGLRHPNLPRVIDHFVIEGQGQYLVMDYIAGQDLRQRLSAEGPVPEVQALEIGIEICKALTYLHASQPPIVHRDIKPGNIKVDPAGHVFLVDFGLAKMAPVGQLTTTGAQALTPGYAPPEQYGKGTDSRSDIYSLGATLYAILTGRIPEDGLGRTLGSAELTPLRGWDPNLSEKTARVIDKAMEVKPDRRFQTAEEFRLALVEALPEGPRGIYPGASSETIAHFDTHNINSQSRYGQQGSLGRKSTRTSESASKPRPKKKTNYLPLILSIVLVSLLFAGAGGALFAWTLYIGRTSPTMTPLPTLPALATVVFTRTSTVAPSAAPTRTPPATSTPAPEPSRTVLAPALPTLTLTAVLSPTPALTPRGGGHGEIAFVSERSGKPQIWMMKSDGSGAAQVTNLGEGACQPDWSPDGMRIVYVSPCSGRKDTYPNSSLYISDSDGKNIRPLNTVPGGDFSPAWSPDGKSIAFVTLRDATMTHIYLYDLDTNAAKILSTSVNIDAMPAWSPDGKSLAYQTNRSAGPRIWIMDVASKAAREFSNVAGGIALYPAWSPDASLITFSQGNPANLIIKETGRTEAQELKVTDRLRPLTEARFSPDGRWLVCESDQGATADIYIMASPNGVNLTQLTKDQGRNYQAVWRPRK